MGCDDHMGGGILNQFGSHVIDLLQYLTTFKASRVHGTLRTLTKTTERINGIRQISSDDLAVFQMECIQESSRSMNEKWSNRNEMFATVTLNGCSHHSQFLQEILICGTKGHLILRNEDLYFRNEIGPETVEELLYHEKDADNTSENNNKKSSSEFNRLPEMFPKGASLLFRHLSNTLKNSSENIIGENKQFGDSDENQEHSNSLASFEDGLYVQAVMEAIRLSSREKSWSKVNVVDEAKEK